MTGHDRPERPTARRRGRGRWAMLAAGALAITLGLGVSVLAGVGSRATGPQQASTVSAGQPAAPGTHATMAPDGTYTTPSGRPATIASLRGAPIMVWFVAGGCASCAASIPAVADHLAALTRSGLRVLTLGLAGAFPPGRPGVAQLLRFARSAAGGPVSRPGWSWGMASRSLSLAYDPAGIPDTYVLIGPAGHISYRNSVPDSTMAQLLAATDRLTANHSPASSTGR